MRAITTEKGNRLAINKKDYIKNLDEDALLTVMATKKGRWFMMRLFDMCRLFSTTFTGNSQTFFNEGVRSVALSYLTQIKSSKKGLALYHKAELEYSQVNDKYNELINESKGDD